MVVVGLGLDAMSGNLGGFLDLRCRVLPSLFQNE